MFHTLKSAQSSVLELMGASLEINIDQFYVESGSVEYFKPSKPQQILKYPVYSSSLQECGAEK